jgi:hypothetical protein
MANTTVYQIEIPDDGGDEGEWGLILNNLTFRDFDRYLRENPSQFLIVNAKPSGAEIQTEGYLRISGGADLVSHWDVKHTNSGSLDFIEYDGASTSERFTIASGGGMYRYASDVSYGPGGIYIEVDPVDQIGDWIAVSTTTYTDVDVSDDGVPAGATAVKIRIILDVSTSQAIVGIRPNGSSSNFNGNFPLWSQDIAGGLVGGEAVVGLDSSGVFEAKFTDSWTGTTNEAFVIGYFI